MGASDGPWAALVLAAVRTEPTQPPVTASGTVYEEHVSLPEGLSVGSPL